MAVFDYYLVLDFEASGTVADSREWEIVEFPIVVVDAHAGKRLPDEFHRYVRPTVNPRISDQCVRNCGINQADVDAASPINVVVEEAAAWVNGLNLNGSFAVVTCGDYDLKTALNSESQRKGLLLPEWLRKWVNIKVPFASRFGVTTGMKGMLERLRLSLDGRHHCGIDDARNISKIVIELLKLGVALEITGSREDVNGTLAIAISRDSAVPTGGPPTDATTHVASRRGRWRKRNAHESSALCADDGILDACKPQPTVSSFGSRNSESHTIKATRKAPARVRIDEPWLSWLVSRVKTHEGRLFRGMWSKLEQGDHLIAWSEKYAHVDLFVKDVIRFDDFDSAFASLGRSLVPEGATTPAEALRLYRQWNSAQAVRDCGGVVAVEVVVGDVHPVV